MEPTILNEVVVPARPRGGRAGFAHPPRNVAAFDLEHGMQVADMGAGSGAYALEMASRVGASGRVYAIDVQKDLLRRLSAEAKRMDLKNLDIIWADVETPGSTKIADRLLDIVLISNLLFQLDDTKSAIAEAKRILKDTGTLVVIDWSESFGGMGPIKDHVITKEEVLKLTAECGFILQREFSAGEHHYGLIFKKA